MNEVTTKVAVTMTSIEIAKMTGKEHFHVLRDIEDELSKISGICNETIFGLVDYGFTEGKDFNLLKFEQVQIEGA